MAITPRPVKKRQCVPYVWEDTLPATINVPLAAQHKAVSTMQSNVLTADQIPIWLSKEQNVTTTKLYHARHTENLPT